jgi:hypothetical protein
MSDKRPSWNMAGMAARVAGVLVFELFELLGLVVGSCLGQLLSLSGASRLCFRDAAGRGSVVVNAPPRVVTPGGDGFPFNPQLYPFISDKVVTTTSRLVRRTVPLLADEKWR